MGAISTHNADFRWTGLISHRNVTFIENNCRKWNNNFKKWSSCLMGKIGSFNDGNKPFHWPMLTDWRGTRWRNNGVARTRNGCRVEHDIRILSGEYHVVTIHSRTLALRQQTHPESVLLSVNYTLAQRSCWGGGGGGVYWFHFHSVRLSVRPSRFLCPLCSAYSYGWIHFIFVRLFKQLKVCRM